jgi:hypothetical protein
VVNNKIRLNSIYNQIEKDMRNCYFPSKTKSGENRVKNEKLLFPLKTESGENRVKNEKLLFPLKTESGENRVKKIP